MIYNLLTCLGYLLGLCGFLVYGGFIIDLTAKWNTPSYIGFPACIFFIFSPLLLIACVFN